MHPTIFETDLFGLLTEPVGLHTYGVLIASGFLVAMILGARQAGKEGEDPDRIIDLAFWLLVSGLIGSRVVFIITKWEEYARDPIEILLFWRGGLVWYGGFIGAAIYIFYYTRKYRLDFFKFVDIIIPYMALAHAFGRLGCLAAGCCFGKPFVATEAMTDAPWWFINFPNDSMAHSQHWNDGLISISDDTLPVHPTQLYEAGAELMMFWILLGVRRIKSFHGQMFLVWIAAYPIIRSIIEMFRGDKERGIYGWFSTSQWISILVATSAVALYFYLRKRRIRQEEAPAPAG